MIIEFLQNIYFTFLYQPIYNLVVILYNQSPGPSLAWAIFILAIIVRLILLPLTLKGYKTDEMLEAAAPQVREVENDINMSSKEKRLKINEILKGRGINPLMEIYSLIGQLLFLAILFQIVQNGITPSGYDDLYSFVTHPTGDINTEFLFQVDVSHPNLFYSFVAAALLFVEQLWEYESKKNIPMATFSERWSPLLLPVFTFILLMLLPGTKAVFLTASILFSLGVRLMYTVGRSGKQSSAHSTH